MEIEEKDEWLRIELGSKNKDGMPDEIEIEIQGRYNKEHMAYALYKAMLKDKSLRKVVECAVNGLHNEEKKQQINNQQIITNA